MKKTVAIILAAALLLGFAACGKANQNSGKANAAGESEIVISDVITMTIKEGTLTNKGVTVILSSNTDDEYIYGEGFFLEVMKDGKWKKLELISEFAVNLVAFHLEGKMGKGSTAEQQIYWERAYGELPAGEYRLVKDVVAEKDTPLDKDFSARKYIAVEFTIEK